MSYDEPCNSDDVIDSRSIIERIAQLESELEDADPLDPENEPNEDDVNELRILRAFAIEGNDTTSEWADGVTLVRDSYFEDYARELAYDIGAYNGDESWPNTCIDWEKAAKDLQYDYSIVSFDGVDYWVQN